MPGEAAHEVLPGYAFDTPGVSASLIPEVYTGSMYIITAMPFISLHDLEWQESR